MNIDQTPYVASAFISCSLRQEDKQFVDYIERILKAHGILPTGTVGRHSAAPSNPAALMKENIASSDMVIIVATPRFLQQDIMTSLQYQGISEMIHAESGISFALDKPVVVFVQEGTQIGNFLPNITQYITLNGYQEDLNKKWSLINSLLNNAYSVVLERRSKASDIAIRKSFTNLLAVVGTVSIINALFEDDYGSSHSKRKKPTR